jgi:acyl-CoA reductase-like NAD-dependent aldehyde dehydrogenase
MAYNTINPATGEAVRSFSEIFDADLEASVEQAQTCFETGWRHRGVAELAGIISAVAARLREHAEEYAHYVTLEMGKLIAEARAEVMLSPDILDYYAKHGRNSSSRGSFRKRRTISSKHDRSSGQSAIKLINTGMKKCHFPCWARREYA